MKNETVLGALIASTILFLTGFVALLNQSGVAEIDDISTKAWVILAVGASVAFLKDYQAITTRRALAGMTGSGNVHSPVTIGILAVILALAISGCAGTQSAYKAADGLEQTAKVVAEHYYALVKEANAMKKAGTLSGDQLAAAQQIVKETAQAIDTLAEAAGSYEQLQNVTTQAELDAAIAKASLAIVKLVTLLDRIRSDSIIFDHGLASEQKPPEDLPEESMPEPLKKAA